MSLSLVMLTFKRSEWPLLKMLSLHSSMVRERNAKSFSTLDLVSNRISTLHPS